MIHNATDTILAYVLGRRKDIVFKERKAWLEPLGISRDDPDDWGAYERH
ncbi:MAG: hypothetical protein GXP14_15755 [Gammaproteobacteria bacterium]|nr:hypothetical protein [Gammaproteobacteria bacterium]